MLCWGRVEKWDVCLSQRRAGALQVISSKLEDRNIMAEAEKSGARAATVW